jgi:hypothetical protein
LPAELYGLLPAERYWVLSAKLRGILPAQRADTPMPDEGA